MRGKSVLTLVPVLTLRNALLIQAISSVSSLSLEDGGGICATYRCEGGVRRLRIRARTTEGDYGDVRLTVVAKTPPKKSAQVRAGRH